MSLTYDSVISSPLKRVNNLLKEDDNGKYQSNISSELINSGKTNQNKITPYSKQSNAIKETNSSGGLNSSNS
jgi:hypothetical protein